MYPRAKSLGIILKDNKILVEERKGKHSTGNGLYYRLIGGTIEFGECSKDTIIREFKEETALDIEIIDYIVCLENIFNIEDNIGHEIIQIYLVEFKDQMQYQKESFKIVEGSKITYAKWISLTDIFRGKIILYPNGLNEVLKNNFNSL
ncbi:NUDIX hydrolase [Psychrobacillus sp. FJAT-51614]|uniref:NUDIX hydrolase n=1 Tax=Psychrobacillus mangrovi TaxID=3117745 RepID=A0ABU8F758_9BACI